MHTFYRLLLLSLLLPTLTLAQSNYQPGYVVNLHGDTIHGYIDYGQWDYNPKKIKFKKELNNTDAELFTVDNATAFAIDKYEYFERYKVKISQNQIRPESIKIGLDTSKITGTVFLRVLKSGTVVNLFSYQDAIKIRYYIQEDHSKVPDELNYGIYFDPQEMSKTVFQMRFRIQLEEIAIKHELNTPAFEQKISRLDYTQSEIIAMVNLLNHQIEKRGTKESANRVGTRIFVGAALNSNHFKYGGDIDLANNGHANSTLFPAPVIGIDLIPNKNADRLFFRAELTFNSLNSAITANPVIDGANGTYNYHVTGSFKQYAAILSPQIIYNFYNTQAVKLYLSAGAALNYLKVTDRSYVQIFDDVTQSVSNYPAFRDLVVTVPLSAGIILNKKIGIYATYVLPADIIDEVYPGKEQTATVGFNYYFAVH